MGRRPKVLDRFQEEKAQQLEFTIANPEQGDLIYSTARETLIDGGVGSGKTVGGVTRLLLLADAYPGSRWFVARQYYKDLVQTTRKTFSRLCPAAWIKRDVLNETTLFNGSEIVWAHLDEYDIKSLMGLEINGAFLDQAEEISPDMYEILDSRIGRWYRPEWPTPCPSYIWSTSNPAGKDYLYFRFHPNCNPPDYRKYIFAPTSINQAILDKYHPGYYANLMRKSPAWRRRWVEASRDIYEGQIFPEFRRSTHLYDPATFDPYKKFDGVCWGWMDYGLTSPTTCLITFTTGKHLFVTREYGAKEKLIKEHALAIKEMVAKNPRAVRGVYADPSMFAESTRDRRVETTSIANEYRAEGLYLLKADHNENSSIDILHEMLHVNPALPHPVTDELGSPSLLINADCVNLIREIEMQRWKEARNPLTGEREFVGVRLDTVADDYFDPLRYFANSKIHHVTVARPAMKLPGYGWKQQEARA